MNADTARTPIPPQRHADGDDTRIWRLRWRALLLCAAAFLPSAAPLAPLARHLGFPKSTPTYALGFSRGGMMILLALSRGLEVRAAALIGSPAELAAPTGDAAAVEEFAARMPGFREQPQEALLRRHARVEPVLYVGESHGVAPNGRERDRHDMAWFGSH